MKTVFSFNPRTHFNHDFAYILVIQLKKLGYRSKSDMGISQMKIQSTASKDAFKIAFSKAEEIFFG